MSAEHLARYEALRPRIRKAIANRRRYADAGKGLVVAWMDAKKRAESGLAEWRDARREAAQYWPEPTRFKQPEGDKPKLAKALDRIATLTAAALAAGWV